MSDAPEDKPLNKLERMKLARDFRAFEYARQKIKLDQREAALRRELEKREGRVAEMLVALADAFEAIAGRAPIRELTREQLRQRLEHYAVLENRLAREMREFGLAAIPARGARLDESVHYVSKTIGKRDAPDGEIVEVLKPGYRLGDRLLRPAQVVVVKNEEGD